MKRSAGILMPIFSLPSEYGIGALDKEAYAFADFLARAGQSVWQILPIGPTGYGDSPYQPFSAYAGNPYFIGLDDLIQEGLLDKAEAETADFGKDVECIDYQKLYLNRLKLLEKAYKRSNVRKNQEYAEFCRKNKEWLDDYGIFAALKEEFNQKPWIEWEQSIKNKDESAVKNYQAKLCDRIEFHKFVQFLFYRQWSKLKNYANQKGIKIIGDIPIYVALDSADAWSNPRLFQFDDKNTPKAVAGCPPDGFSAKGQLWGNPLYDWEEHQRSNYKWWVRRMEHCFELFDVVRIDHFRGFAEYYSIPYGATDAVNGHWEKGPGWELFDEISRRLGKKEIIAEDLGFITEDVKKLLKDCGFPGMKVLEFAFDFRDENSKNDYLPHNYPKNSVAYTGTHDNQTLSAWFNTVSKQEQALAREYLCDFYTPDSKLNMPFISLIMRSNANLCIIPIQDYLELDDSARINTPSTLGKNWRWRIKKSSVCDELAEKIKRISALYGRVSEK